MVNLRDSDGRSLYFSNRKEYYRRIKISEGVKKYYAEKIKEVVTPKRIRNQLTLNSDYFISLRAVGLNKTEDELDKAITEVLNSNIALMKIPFDSEGLESEELDQYEDKFLNDGRIEIELNIRGTVTYFTK